MGNTQFKLLLCLCSFLLTLLSCGARENCAQFAFVKLNATEITAVVNTFVTLTFTVNYSKCERRYNYTAQIYRNGMPLCSISFSNGSCTNPLDIIFCFCESNVGPLTFNKIVMKEDNGIWIWKAINDNFETIALTHIYFKIISRSRITSLTVDGREEQKITLRKKNVILICSWINGDPPGTAKLLLNDILVNSSRTSGNISFQFSANLEPNGVVIRCDANGSERNMSTVLFISENRPVFLNSSFKSFEVRSGKTFNFTFLLRVHEPERLQCNLYMTKSFGVDIKPRWMNGDNCSVIWSLAETLNSKFLNQQNAPKTQAPGSLQENCVCSFSGTPPNLSLTFFMQNEVKEKDLGSWRLTVSNNDGIDHQDFFLFVIKEDKIHGEGVHLVAIGLLGSILAVVVASSFAYLVRVNKCHQKFLESEEPTENRAESKGQCQSVSDIDLNNLLPIHKLDRSRDSGFLDINSLIVQE